MSNHDPNRPYAVVDALSNRSSGDSSAPAGPDDGNAADEDQSLAHQVSQQSSRKRLRHDFPWSYTRDWQDSDPQRVRGRRQCNLCKKWFSPSTNAQGWKVHLKKQHDVKATPSVLHGDTEEAALASRQSLQVQQSMKKRTFPGHVVRAFENAIVDFVIGGDISLRAAVEQRFQELVLTLTGGYTPPSTRTIVRRTVELFSVAQPLLGKFLCELDVRVSLTNHQTKHSNANLQRSSVDVSRSWNCNFEREKKKFCGKVSDKNVNRIENKQNREVGSPADFGQFCQGRS